MSADKNQQPTNNQGRGAATPLSLLLKPAMRVMSFCGRLHAGLLPEQGKTVIS